MIQDAFAGVCVDENLKKNFAKLLPTSKEIDEYLKSFFERHSNALPDNLKDQHMKSMISYNQKLGDQNQRGTQVTPKISQYPVPGPVSIGDPFATPNPDYSAQLDFLKNDTVNPYSQQHQGNTGPVNPYPHQSPDNTNLSNIPGSQYPQGLLDIHLKKTQIASKFDPTQINDPMGGISMAPSGPVPGRDPSGWGSLIGDPQQNSTLPNPEESAFSDAKYRVDRVMPNLKHVDVAEKLNILRMVGS